MRTPHKHAAVIKAWAEGAGVQVRGNLDIDKWTDVVGPGWYEGTRCNVCNGRGETP